MASGRPPRRQQQQANSCDGFTDSNVSAASSSVTTRRSPPPSSSSLAVEEAASAAVARAAEASTTPRILSSSGGRSRTPPPRSLREGMIATASTTTPQHDTVPSSSSGGGRRSSSSSGGGGRRRTMGTMRNDNSDNNNNNNNNDDNSGNDYDNSIMSAVAEVMANDNTTIQTSRTATATTTLATTTTTIPKKKKQRSLILLGSKPRGMYECDYCSTDLTRVPRIRCAICPDFDLCLDCFATEDHVHMAKYKREEESQRRKDEARHHHQQQQQQQQSKEEEKDEALGGGGVKDIVNMTPNKGGKLKRNDKQGTKKKGVVDDNDNDDEEEEEIMALRDEDIGSYIHGKWVPYFQHESTHGYIVADSTRYVLFPPFRGVVPIVAAGELATVATALPLGGGAELASAATENKDQEEMEDVATAIATSDDISGNKMTGINYHQEEQEEEKGEVALTSEELDTVSKQITFSSSSSSSAAAALSSVAAPMETHNLNENNSEDTTPKHSNMFEIVDTTAATTTTTTTTTTISAAASDNNNDDDGGGGGVHPFSQGIVIKDPVLLAEIVAAVTTTIDTINTNNNVNIDNDDDDEKATLDDDTMVVSQQVNDNNAKNSVASVVNTVIDGLNRSSIHNNSHKSSFRLQQQQQQQQQQRKPHRYRLVDDINKAIWTTEEDLALLDGILTCGLGNWPTIAEHVNGGGAEGGSNGNGGGAEESGRGGSANYGSSSSSSSSSSSNSGGKTDKQCMERYLDDFMGRYGCILPPYTMVPDDNDEEGGSSDGSITPPVVAAVAATSLAVAQDGPVGEVDGSARKRLRRNASSTFLDFDDTAPGFKRIKFKVIPTEELEEFKGLSYQPYIPPNMKMGDEVARDLWYRSEQYFVRQLTNATSKADADIIRKEFIERHKQGIPGYEARVLPPRLEDMKQLPGAELAGFMPRRGDFDIEWDNDAEKTIAEMEFSPDDTKADRELKLDVLRIFNTKLGEREKRRQFIIDHGLLNYRENQEKLWAMPPDERHLVQRMRLFARFQTRDEHEAFVNKILEAKRLRKEIAKLQMYRRMGITSLADIEKYEMDKVRCELHKEAWTKKEDENRKAADEAARAVRENADYVPSTNPVVPPFGKLDGPVGAEVNQSLQLWKQHMKPTKKEDECEGTKSNDNADTETSTATKFIIKDKPNYDLLSKKEVELCKRLRLLPQSYLDVKRALINEALAQGLWDPTTANNVQKQQQSRSIFKVDVTQCDNIIDFVLEAGWIPTRPSIIDDA